MIKVPDRLKVLLVGYMYGEGGIQTHTHYLATGLGERDHRVTVVTPPPMTRHGTEPPRQEGDYQLVTYGGLGSVFGGLGTGRDAAYDVAVLCGTGWKSMAGMLALPRPTKRIFFEVMSGARVGRLDPRMLVHGGFDAIVGQGRPVEQKFCKEFGWKGMRTTIPALPEPLERRCNIPARRTLPFEVNKKLKLVYFGRLAPHKGVAYLIDNWERLSRVAQCLDIYGSGPQEEELRQRISSRGLGEVIRLRGRYPGGQDYVDLMQDYDLKLLPTVGAEGAPLVLLEAMACGLPFIANGVGGIPDYANEDCGITSGNIEEFLPLFDNYVERMMKGNVDTTRLQYYYDKHFSFDSLVDRWDRFLRLLVSGDNQSSDDGAQSASGTAAN